MKTFIAIGGVLVLLTGCSASSMSAGILSTSTATTGGTSGGTTTGMGIMYKAAVGATCAAVGVVDICAQSGLVCDSISGQCRKPQMGEQCDLDVGCNADEPPNPPSLSCVTANLNGTEVNICLVRCQGTDSSACPYGMTCYSNYCKAEAPASCVPGQACPLAPSVQGQCLSDGMSSTCFATGDLRQPYEPCNPYAMNSDAAELCAVGSICRATPLTLGGFADAGFCFPLCGTAGCQPDDHCEQPGNAFYQICRPGPWCSLDGDGGCYGGTSVCVPDDASSLNGGCLPLAPDAGAIGDACELPQAIPETSECQEGACLPADGGAVCTPLCNRTSGGVQPACEYYGSYTCDPLNGYSSGAQVVGNCG